MIAGEAIAPLGWLGILLISSGVYLVNADSRVLLKSPLAPLRELANDRGAQAMLGVSVLWSIGAHLSKMRVDGSDVLFSTFTSAVIGVVMTAIMARLRSKSISLSHLKQNFMHLAPVGISYFFASILTGAALVRGSTSYVFTAKRSSIVFSAAIGAFLFKEEMGVLRWAGILLTLSGICCLAA